MAAAEEDRYEEAAERLEHTTLSRGGRGKGGGRRGGRGGGGGGGDGGSGRDRDFLLSKALSTLLRHQAQNAGIKLDAEGFAPLDKVLQWPRIRSLNPTVADIKKAVADSAKQRFAIKPNPEASGSGAAAPENEDDPAAWLIRANQGHSIALASEALHAPVTLEAGNVPAVVVHGTYFAFWDAIVAAGGLHRMGRTHVHFGTRLPPDDVEDAAAASKGHNDDDDVEEKEKEEKAAVSGMRGDAELLVFVDVERSLRDGEEEKGGGLKWWISANGVVLTEGNEDGVVPLRYFREVRGRRQGVGVLWRDGVQVAELPADVVKRVPYGKNGSGGRGGRGGRGKGRGRGR